MKIAILDLGTNIFQMLIAETNSENKIEILKQLEIAVKLGEGGIHKNIIATAAYERGIKTIAIFSEEIKKYNVEKTFAFATSAIRSADNGKQFCDEIFSEFNIEVKTISGNEEAELIYKGVVQTINFEDDFLLMDIGGGSVEFIIGNKKNIFWKQSFAIGAARLRELFHRSDPASDEELQQLENYLYNELQPLFFACKKFPATKLVGAAGSFETFLKMKNMYSKEINFYEFSIAEFLKIYNELISSDENMRIQMTAITGFRTDMIVMATSLVEFILRRCKIKEMYISTYSLKEGVFYNFIK